MKTNIILVIGAMFTAMLLVSMIFAPAVAATQATPLNEPTATDSKSVYSDSNLPKDLQDQVIEAIKASSLSDVEKKELIKNLKDIWSNKSDLSESEQKAVFSKAVAIVFNYLGIDQKEVGVLWNWQPHSDLARTAGIKMGVPSAYWQTLYSEANYPDSLPRYWGDHYWFISDNPPSGDGPAKTKQYADEARNYIKNQGNPSEGYKRLSWSTHYMSDLANPWHTTSSLLALYYHSDYERYVSDNWNSGKNYNQTVQDNWYYYYINDPEADAKNLAAVSNQYLNYILDKIINDPNWQNDATVISDTRTVLTHAIRYDMGLVNYATR